MEEGEDDHQPDGRAKSKLTRNQNDKYIGNLDSLAMVGDTNNPEEEEEDDSDDDEDDDSDVGDEQETSDVQDEETSDEENEQSSDDDDVDDGEGNEKLDADNSLDPTILSKLRVCYFVSPFGF